QAEARHAQEAVDVRLEHGLLVFLVAGVEGLAAEAEAGIVDEDVEASELVDSLLDEALAARRVGHVELERDLRLELLGAASAAGDPRPVGRARSPSVVARRGEPRRRPAHRWPRALARWPPRSRSRRR